MIHVGDITKLNGAELPVVDVISGGSPCQDLSNAGKRAGLAGERSGLFMDMVRIVKEMREHDRATGRTGQFIRPRYMVWENVPGAFSSNKGKDFQAVLEEIIHIVQEAPDLPMPNGGWPKQGCLYDEMGEWSIAWRVHDAQFWGVPQRRKRLALVADFGGRSAPEILFERKGLSWDSSESERKGESVAGRTGRSTDTASGIVTKGNGDAFVTNGRHTSLTGGGGQAGQGYPCVMETGKCLNPFEHQAKQVQPENGKANALYAGECRYGGGESYVLKTVALEGNGSRPSHHGDGFKVTDKMYSLNTVDRHAIFADIYNHSVTGDVAATLNATSCDSPTHSGPSVITNEVLNDRTSPK